MSTSTEQEKSETRRFHKARSLLSPAEHAFFLVLRDAVPEAPIFPKVRVADIICPKNRYCGDFLRVSQKHFDWVLCHPVSFEPLVAIELDDSSHRLDGRQIKNDKTKDEAARDAGLTLLRFPWQNQYDTEAVRKRIAEAVNAI